MIFNVKERKIEEEEEEEEEVEEVEEVEEEEKKKKKKEKKKNGNRCQLIVFYIIKLRGRNNRIEQLNDIEFFGIIKMWLYGKNKVSILLNRGIVVYGRELEVLFIQ